MTRNEEFWTEETFATSVSTFRRLIDEGKVDESGQIIYFSPSMMQGLAKRRDCENCPFYNYCDEYIACE